MKKLSLTLLFFYMLCGTVLATDSIVVGFGTASGKTTVSGSSNRPSVFSPLGHDTKGSSWNIGYQKILDNGLLVGGGYQNFEVSGEKSEKILLSGRLIQIKFKTEKFSVSGIYVAIGYSLETMENLFFQPNLRLGIANKYEAKYSFTGGNPISKSENKTMFGIVLPLVYQLGNFNIGGQILAPVGGDLTAKAPDGLEVKGELSTAFQLVVGFNF